MRSIRAPVRSSCGSAVGEPDLRCSDGNVHLNRDGQFKTSVRSYDGDTATCHGVFSRQISNQQECQQQFGCYRPRRLGFFFAREEAGGFKLVFEHASLSAASNHGASSKTLP
jgi:hypothetical protein